VPGNRGFNHRQTILSRRNPMTRGQHAGALGTLQTQASTCCQLLPRLPGYHKQDFVDGTMFDHCVSDRKMSVVRRVKSAPKHRKSGLGRGHSGEFFELLDKPLKIVYNKYCIKIAVEQVPA